MIVGNIAIGIGVHGIVRRVGLQLHARVKLFMILRLGAGVGLSERLKRLLHKFNAYPLAFLLANYRSVMTVVDSEVLSSHIITILIRKAELSLS